MNSAVRTRIRAALAACASGCVATGLIWGAAPAQAVQPPRAAGLPASPAAVVAEPAPLLDAGSPDGQRFRASGRLVGGGGTTCTATLVHATGKPDPGAKALVLSNGHCVDDAMGTNDVVVDKAAPADWSYTPAYFHDNVAEHRKFSVERVVYATMKDIDVSVLQLSATYGDLARLDVTPRTLATGRPAAGTALRAAHAPTDGVEDGRRFLRLSRCEATASGVALHENTWLWKGSTRTDCLGISGGSSGGAVTTADDTGRLVGMLNTIATPGYPGCGPGRPCEGGAKGLIVPEDNAAYVTPVDDVASCLDAKGLRLRKKGCRLDRGEQAKVTGGGLHTQSTTADGPARWNVHVTPGTTGNGTHVAFKSGPFGAVDCTRPEGYAKPRRLTGAGVDHKEVLPKKDNLYVLCVAAGPDGTLKGAAWAASLAHPAYAYARVDNTAPTIAPTIDSRLFGEGEDASYRVSPVYAPWEITGYKVKYGPRATTDCADTAGYRFYLGIPASLKAVEGPWTYCAIGYDNAGNATPPAAFALSPEGARDA
ncbi:trypsin-like peptidase domain-containing protein [Streptomyces albireticuli]|uniref:trypsin-like peptidase domain-containing protein n=1 Tax=Streptomyces albireticuli TaxID=1940 RepID=UPI001475B2B4|nr:trypsin-like peptidase domain-containing protein [Streptomyces albireticuli]MCD9144953.1 trypsin-like peptidase domain-containing protein [Streptomyces albireticuli]MCD9164379.1 trypsin-like peptidase domain-containing protein [Streptomyces albireticuli]MCD9194090.1 trypsin-like peptidase domain-containing protein [Streptomyces albireticuli]